MATYTAVIIMSVSFYPITAADLPQLMPIEISCHSHPWSEKTFKSCIGGRYFGDYIKQSEQMIGFFIADYVAGEATLMDICVPPSHQGQGLGKLLLQAFIKQAKTLGSEQLWLEVRSKNIAAQMLYINQGFIETGRRTGYYPSAQGFGYEDAIIMNKTL